MYNPSVAFSFFKQLILVLSLCKNSRHNIPEFLERKATLETVMARMQNTHMWRWAKCNKRLLHLILFSKIWFKGKLTFLHTSWRHLSIPNAVISQVPVGTMIRDEENCVLADLNSESDLYIAARGGAGGKGNYFFLTNENRAPMVYEKGGESETKRITAELRVMAHAGLVSVTLV